MVRIRANIIFLQERCNFNKPSGENSCGNFHGKLEVNPLFTYIFKSFKSILLHTHFCYITFKNILFLAAKEDVRDP